MMTITLLDTSIATDNLGDEIIMEAIEGIARSLFSNAYIYKVATHEYMTRISRDLIKRSEVAIVCGTNILSSNMAFRPVWKVRPWDPLLINNCVLLGAGWRDYSHKRDPYTRWLLRRMLASNRLQSARDNYTKEHLIAFGVKAVNTTCPTMWSLHPRHCDTIPLKKAQDVVTALTWYKPNLEADKALLECLTRNYRRVYLWTQQRNDQDYYQRIAGPAVTVIDPSLRSFDRILEDEDVDYVGLRLHAGIRALQKRRRSLILPVDNRATEISRDTGLPIQARDRVDLIEQWIGTDEATRISLPTPAIDAWKKQFV